MFEENNRLEVNNEMEGSKQPEPMSDRDYRRFMFAATWTALGVGVVISLGIILFVLFCVYVWL